MSNAGEIQCLYDGCDFIGRVRRGLCTKHYMREYRAGTLDENYPIVVTTGCPVFGCKRGSRSTRQPLCETHYYRIYRNGTIELSVRESTGECLHCGAETSKVFCSKRCTARNRRSRDEIDRECKSCGVQILASERIDKRFCSKRCGINWRYNNDMDFRERVISYKYARKKGLVGCHSGEEWEALKKLYGNRCLSCGSTGPLTRDHIVPISRGGTDDISNIQPLCRSCNSRKYTKAIDYRSQ